MGCLLALLAWLPAQDDVRKFPDVGPSVVALKSAEGHGTGMILDEAGLILTNAHVVASPLILQAFVETGPRDGRRVLVYNRITLVGVHPQYDLALVRLDPEEHGVKLQPVRIAPARPASGETVFAVGFPAMVGKAVSVGTFRGGERQVGDLTYLETELAILPGNSGGPLFDREGRAFGVITFRVYDERAQALAAPLPGFRTDHFVTWGRRPRDPAASAQYVRAAEKQFQAGNLPMAVALYHAALTRDLANPELYFRMGMIYRRLGRDPFAAAYLMRSLQLDPWADGSVDCYHELGLTLLRLGKLNEARLVWEEAAAKYPDQSGKVWDALAEFWWNAGNPLEAGYASRVAVKVSSQQGAQMNELYKRARAALNRDQERSLFDRQMAIDEHLRERKELSAKTRARSQDFLIRACERLVRDYEGIQREARQVDFSALGHSYSIMDPTPLSVDEVARLFTRTRILVARELVALGIKERAIGALEDLLAHYPDREEIAEARTLLAEWKRDN